ncbi:hypothetical protein VP01_3228g1 [Puccinia sorghi]|uniref:Uncharacterized protein n=1 Tax=Puccinia sorghi TaxID=27349 RepID=A0A0L6UYB1_9BASI|nr:hypothetical protein VP01_3228g1 [Puccinia sorghi]
MTLGSDEMASGIQTAREFSICSLEAMHDWIKPLYQVLSVFKYKGAWNSPPCILLISHIYRLGRRQIAPRIAHCKYSIVSPDRTRDVRYKSLPKEVSFQINASNFNPHCCAVGDFPSKLSALPACGFLSGDSLATLNPLDLSQTPKPKFSHQIDDKHVGFDPCGRKTQILPLLLRTSRVFKTSRSRPLTFNCTFENHCLSAPSSKPESQSSLNFCSFLFSSPCLLAKSLCLHCVKVEPVLDGNGSLRTFLHSFRKHTPEFFLHNHSRIGMNLFIRRFKEVGSGGGHLHDYWVLFLHPEIKAFALQLCLKNIFPTRPPLDCPLQFYHWGCTQTNPNNHLNNVLRTKWPIILPMILNQKIMSIFIPNGSQSKITPSNTPAGSANLRSRHRCASPSS